MPEQQINNQTENSEFLPRRTKIFYGMGSVSEVLMGNLVFMLGYQIYNAGLGLKPALIGIVFGACRVWDAFSDPIIANISDNFHSRYGRRRPFMFIGTLIAAVFCILMWMPPDIGDWELFIFFLVTAVCYYTFYTVFSIPYHALGAELTSDYHQRSNLMGYKILFMGFGATFFLPWAYKLCFLLAPNGGDSTVAKEVAGARIVGVVFAVLFFLFCFGPVFFCKERFADFNKEKISILQAIKYTFKNKPFVILIMTVVTTVFGVYMVNTLGFYINLSYVFNGDKNATATIDVWYKTILGITSILGILLIRYAVKIWDKKITLIVSFVVTIGGFGLSWFLFNPKMPYLQLIHAVITGPSMTALWMLAMIMIADAADVDELTTGLRREGMYTAVFGWFMKVALAGPAILSGFILEWSGFDADIVKQTSGTAMRLRLVFMIIPIAFLILAIITISFYSLDRAKMEQVQTQLQQNRKEQ